MAKPISSKIAIWVNKRLQQPVFVLLLLLVATLGCCVFTYRMWKYDYFTYPLVYKHDGMESLKLIQNLIETDGHWQTNTRLAAPFGSNLYGDFPTADMLSVGMLAGLSRLSLNPFLIHNLFAFLTYLLVAVSSYWVLIKLRIKPWLAAIGGLVYSFLPYHQIRVSVGHLFLSNYFTVPIIIWLALQLIKEDFDLKYYLNWYRLLIIGGLLLIIGSVGSGYYLFFAILTWLIAGLISGLRYQRWQAMSASLMLTVGATLILLINLFPTLQYQFRYGVNFKGERDFQQVQEFGLSLSRMITPLPANKPEAVQQFLASYYENTQHESWQYLGLVGIIGLIYLLSRLVIKGTNHSLEKPVALIGLGLILWGASGGFGLLFGFLVTSTIRANNRLSIFIAFISIYLLLQAVQAILEKQANDNRRYLLVGLTLIISLISLVDQTQAINPHQNYWQVKASFDRDQKFFSRIEQEIPQVKTVFQLPFMTYPEGRGRCLLDSYTLFNGFLHTTDISWSFGAVAGREAHEWIQWASRLPVEMMLPILAVKGYDGIMLDDRGCIDAWSWENKLANVVNLSGLGQAKTISSQDNQLILIDISRYKSNFLAVEQLAAQGQGASQEKSNELLRHIENPLLWNLSLNPNQIERQPAGLNFAVDNSFTVGLINRSDYSSGSPISKPKTAVISFRLSAPQLGFFESDTDLPQVEIKAGERIFSQTVVAGQKIEIKIPINQEQVELVISFSGADDIQLYDFSIVSEELLQAISLIY